MRRRGSDAKYVAAVLAVGTECDIGMLAATASGFYTVATGHPSCTPLAVCHAADAKHSDKSVFMMHKVQT